MTGSRSRRRSARRRAAVLVRTLARARRRLQLADGGAAGCCSWWRWSAIRSSTASGSACRTGRSPSRARSSGWPISSPTCTTRSSGRSRSTRSSIPRRDAAEDGRRARPRAGDEPGLPHEEPDARAAAAAVHRADRAVAPSPGSGSSTPPSAWSTGCWWRPAWPNPGPTWLGNPHLAMFSMIMVNTWRGLPFYGITLLAGLQTIPPELYEAATIDGAGGWGRFRYVTLPLLMPIIFIVTMFSVIFTFADFQLVYVLTHGGPANATHLFATYAFDIAMGAGQFGLGAVGRALHAAAAGAADRRAWRSTCGGRSHDRSSRATRHGVDRAAACGLWLPLGVFLVFALFPFYWMAITSLKTNQELYNRKVMPLIVHNPTLEALCRPADRDQLPEWTWNTMLVARRSPRRSRWCSAPCSPIRWRACASPAPPLVSFADRRDLPGAAAAAVRAAGRPDQPARPRQHADLGDPDLPDPAGAVLRLAAAGLFQDRAERARGRRPHRRRQPAADPGQDRPAAVHARASSPPASSPSPCRRTSSSTR